MVTDAEEIPTAVCPSCGAAIEGDLTACFSCGYARRTPTLKKGQRISGRYELTGVLGRGGMGTVYRAHDHSLDEEVALKVLTESVEDSADSNRRFRAEIRLARKVRHPNVCAIHEYGELEDLQYIVMELIHGQDLRKYLDSCGRLPITEALDIAGDIGEGLQAIHHAGVIHRDLKLANVMRDGTGHLRLMDFGIAKRAGDPMSTVTGHIMGTPEYMSPEQVQGQPVDIRTDIYSLGVVTYELLTGRLPFKAETSLGVILMQVNEPPPLDDPDIPREVAVVLGKALAKKPEDRFESARAFLEALTIARASFDSRVQAARGAAAAATGGGARARAAGRTRFIGVGSAALVFLGVITWLAVRTHEPERPPGEPVPAEIPSEQPTPADPTPVASAAALPVPTPTAAPVLERAVAPRRAPTTPAPSPSVRATRESALAATPAPASPSPAAPSPAPAPATPSPTRQSAAAVVPAPRPGASSTPSASAAATTPAPAGYLEIKAAPFAQLAVDGIDQGTVSDMRTLELAPGRHVIRFLHRDYQPLQRIVTIRTGETARVFVDLKLDAFAK